jgi:DNA excision repair protein ERCC-4
MIDQKALPTNPAVSSTPARIGKDGIDPLTIQSKLVLLTLHFPRLRIIWSSSPWATVDIFRDLKLNHPEPDVGEAINAGSDEDAVDAVGGGGGLYNTGPLEMLRSLPGVTSRNWKLVVSRVGSVKELMDLEDELVRDVLGQEGAMEFRAFVDKDAR